MVNHFEGPSPRWLKLRFILLHPTCGLKSVPFKQSQYRNLFQIDASKSGTG